MESRILIKNIGKSKGGQTETFSASQFRELTIGRDPSCDIKFDPNDDLVSRRHSKITRVSDAPEYTIADLGSRNGTIVNRKRIFEPTRLNCGDIVQLGPDGPQFQFDLDPRPASMIKPTRLSDAPIGVGTGTTLAPTRESPAPLPPTREAPSAPASQAGHTVVGKATVERMIGETKRKSQRTAYLVAVGLLVVIGGVSALLYYILQPPPPPPACLNPAEIAQRNTEATVYFEVAWKLIYTVTGEQLYNCVIPNPNKEKIPGGDWVPAFFADSSGNVEPWLSTEAKTTYTFKTDDGTKKVQSNNNPIGGLHSGSGFVVSNDGFILTNRHVAAAWQAEYDFPPETRYGVVIGPDEGGKSLMFKSIDTARIRRWIPDSAKFLTLSCQDLTTRQRLPQFLTVKVFEGRNDYLDVTFAKNRIRIPAKLARVSDRQDVAMVKIDLPQSLKKVTLNDNYDTIKVGDPVVSLGYPAVSERVLGVALSRDILNQRMTAKEIPDPTLSVGNIGRILRGASGMEQAKFFGGDYYQLTINSTGEGNSGGPVFDCNGQVISIFTLGIKGDVNISGAIPIRYATELMSVKPMEAR